MCAVGDQELANRLHTIVTLSQIGQERERRPAIVLTCHLGVLGKTCAEVAIMRRRSTIVDLVEGSLAVQQHVQALAAGDVSPEELEIAETAARLGKSLIVSTD